MPTTIEWTEETWNPVTGCSKVSPGCAHCYAERIALQKHWTPYPWTAQHAADNVQLHPERLNRPRQRRKPTMWFVCSMADLFHELVPDAFIANVWAVMRDTPQHAYQILTKRAARLAATAARLPYVPNVWLGVSVEAQPQTERLPYLVERRAAVRFVSAEPLLGPVDLSAWLPLLQWVIVGGESGKDARPMHPDWARAIRDQCGAAGVPFFFKQWGGAGKVAGHWGGNILDGQTWQQMPTIPSEKQLPLL